MWGSLPFRLVFAVWVEICGRRHLESLPFSTDFRCLGRDMRPAGLVNLYLFQLIFAVWVEICGRGL